jgi:hypothetical protein
MGLDKRGSSGFSADRIWLLVAVADGTLPVDRVEDAERELLARRDFRAALERQRRAVAAVRAAAPAVPGGLKRRIESQALGSPRRVPRWRPALAGSLAVSLLALLAVTLLPGPAGEPDMARVADLATREGTAPAPAKDPARQGLLAEEADGIPYPDWRKKFGWKAEGARTDELGGRRAETVFYEHRGHRIGYTILSGKALDPPRGARRTVRNGVELHAFRDGPRTVVTFERAGRTCVLSGDVRRRRTLFELAAWLPGRPGSHDHSHS